ncbi:MAG TPA: FHA domain-containing protein [Aeromonadales bacterium]|nr:FHA domain-containing protein [Aeromonadales bacterium]
MYYDFFNLNEHPFRLTTDPKFLFLSSSHSRARAYMEYAVRNHDKLFILSGEIGSGKSLVIQDFLASLDDSTLAFRIHQTLLNNVEFLQMLLREFGIKSFHDRKVELLDQIYTYLVEQHRNNKQVILIVDEAQNLAPEVMEEIRLLLEFEKDGNELLSLFLIGQPGLNTIIDQPELEQLRQRARLRYHLEALGEEDIEDYINHRLKVAGEEHTVSIDSDVFPLIYEYTGGRPRLINVLMDHALTCAFVDSKKQISIDMIQTSITELNWQPFDISAENIPVLTNGNDTNAVISDEITISASRKIIVRKNGRWVGEYPLNKQCFNIGRHSDNDIVLKEPRISRLHAQIILNDDEIFIQDMNSKNGTFNGETRIDLHALQLGDVITIASYELAFTSMDDEQAGDITESVNILQYPFQSKNKH